MSDVITSAKVENLEDLYAVHRGSLTPDRVRTLDVDNALVDERVVGLMIPTRLLPALGLRSTHQRWTRSADGVSQVQVYEAVRLTIQGRECSIEVYEVPDPNPVIVGLVPLGALDWVVDAVGRRLIGNPEHGGEHIAEAVSAWL